MTNQYHNVTDENLVGTILLLEHEVDEATIKLKIAKNALIERKSQFIAASLKAKPEPFGSVSESLESVALGKRRIVFTTPKKVEWAQDGLAKVREQIIADGENPNEYIKSEFKVEESKYKNWPTNVRRYFEPYRTVTPGNIAVKIEEAKE